MKYPNRIVSSLLLCTFLFMNSYAQQQPVRARDLGIPFIGRTGKFNAITDVPGVKVGLTTLVSGEGPWLQAKGRYGQA